MKLTHIQKEFAEEVCKLITEKYSMKGISWRFYIVSEGIAFVPYQYPQGAFEPLDLEPLKGNKVYYGLEELQKTTEELAWKVAKDNKNKPYKTFAIMIT
ncbi:hypothetical protein AAU57_14670 [Nonlabens sp. YIK11]|uniref:hypothetical protein n=1 Tax=Nonlabens sp. YIK11 TaxID=1453349 RepID=UPI0006DCF24A|nr:hypothetical protein [Nonlabens sp. YIK11]KQC31854.1 hypothetical protein AAU57_14670 [Nonlabens sp. YIK11]